MNNCSWMLQVGRMRELDSKRRWASLPGNLEIENYTETILNRFNNNKHMCENEIWLRLLYKPICGTEHISPDVLDG